MVRDGMVCELFDLQRAARLRLSAIGGEHAIGSPADRAVVSQVLRCPPSTTAIGVGVVRRRAGLPRIGAASSSRSRARPCACPPTERKWPTTWSRRARRRRNCTSRAAWSATAPSPGTCASSRPSRAASSRSRRWQPCASSWRSADAAALVAMVETAGLVGAALRKSPLLTEEDDFFAFPALRTRLTFTAERAFARLAGAHRRRRAARRGRAATSASSARSTTTGRCWGTSTPPRFRSGPSRRGGSCSVRRSARSSTSRPCRASCTC